MDAKPGCKTKLEVKIFVKIIYWTNYVKHSLRVKIIDCLTNYSIDKFDVDGCWF